MRVCLLKNVLLTSHNYIIYVTENKKSKYDISPLKLYLFMRTYSVLINKLLFLSRNLILSFLKFEITLLKTNLNKYSIEKN